MQPSEIPAYKVLVASAPDNPLAPYIEREFAPDADVRRSGFAEAEGNARFVVAVRPTLAEARALAARLDEIRPESVAVISTTDVYGATGDTLVDETFKPRPSDSDARDAAAAEDAFREWASARGIRLAVLRAATTFGADMGGWPDRMFARVIGGRFVHIRGCEARRSIVTAVDVARAVRAALPLGGLYNIADGFNPGLTELAEAMGTNAGLAKRRIVLPRKWAAVIASFCKAYHIPHAALRAALDACTPAPLFSSELAAETLGLKFFNTCDVLRRQASGYPYLTPQND